MVLAVVELVVVVGVVKVYVALGGAEVKMVKLGDDKVAVKVNKAGGEASLYRKVVLGVEGSRASRGREDNNGRGRKNIIRIGLSFNVTGQEENGKMGC